MSNETIANLVTWTGRIRAAMIEAGIPLDMIAVFASREDINKMSADMRPHSVTRGYHGMYLNGIRLMVDEDQRETDE